MIAQVAPQQPDTLMLLAQQINDADRECRKAQEIAESANLSALAHAKEAGELLLRAKAELKEREGSRGRWIPWINQHCTVAERTAQQYMAVAKHWEILQQKLDDPEKRSLRQAIKVLAAAQLESADDGYTFDEVAALYASYGQFKCNTFPRSAKRYPYAFEYLGGTRLFRGLKEAVEEASKETEKAQRKRESLSKPAAKSCFLCQHYQPEEDATVWRCGAAPDNDAGLHGIDQDIVSQFGCRHYKRALLKVPSEVLRSLIEVAPRPQQDRLRERDRVKVLPVKGVSQQYWNQEGKVQSPIRVNGTVSVELEGAVRSFQVTELEIVQYILSPGDRVLDKVTGKFGVVQEVGAVANLGEAAIPVIKVHFDGESRVTSLKHPAEKSLIRLINVADNSDSTIIENPPEPITTTLRVGDRVICREHPHSMDDWIIKEIKRSTATCYSPSTQQRAKLRLEDLEPYTPEKAFAKFKAGDRVRDTQDYHEGGVFTVTQDTFINGMTPLNNAKGIGYSLHCSELVLVRDDLKPDIPTVVETQAPTAQAHHSLIGLDELHYAVRRIIVLNSLSWTEQMVDDAADSMLEFLSTFEEQYF
jgi:hypothetical protein